MPEQERNSRSALVPLVLLWLAAHALLLAALLGAKFLLTKTMLLLFLMIGATVFLFSRIRARPRKLTHSPMV